MKKVFVLTICLLIVFSGCLNNKKENLLDSFKNELEKKKDLETVISWIRKKDYRGKNYYKKINAVKTIFKDN